MKTLNVVGAILINEGQVLCAQRGAGKFEYVSYKYEFPGGKIELGETSEEALHRELIEEMLVNIPTEAMEYFDIADYEYPDFFLSMATFICRIDHRNVTLTEHLDVKWLSPGELDTLDWVPADWPIVKKLMEIDI